MKILNLILLAPVRFYRRFISPLFPPTCRFTPTCSLYCIQAVEEWGPIRGFGLAIWRILRCNPWCRGGYDPVPENKKRRERLNKKENRKKES